MHLAAAAASLDTLCHRLQDGAYDTPERVMKGAQRMAAQLLAAEPGIRQFVRREFMDSAVVTTGADACRES